jgi:hypothetical protein
LRITIHRAVERRLHADAVERHQPRIGSAEHGALGPQLAAAVRSFTDIRLV